MESLLFDFRWNDGAKPLFQVAHNGEREEHFLQIGDTFSLTVEDTPIRCVGSFRDGKYDPCPTGETGTKKCEMCKRGDEYFPCQFCNGLNCDRFRDKPIENCGAEHMVYLALFTPELIKVGVSRLSRERIRQVEQGSHFTQILAEGLSGISARRMETILCRYGFPDKVPVSQKKDFLFPEISLEEGKVLLEKKSTDAKEVIRSEMPELGKFLLSEEKFWDNRSFYAKDFDMMSHSPKAVHFLSLQSGESISGNLVLVKGVYFAIETPDEFVVLCAKDLIGRTVSFASLPIGLRTKEAFQSALF